MLSDWIMRPDGEGVVGSRSLLPTPARGQCESLTLEFGGMVSTCNETVDPEGVDIDVEVRLTPAPASGTRLA